MKEIHKLFIKSFLLNGLIFAVLMAGSDYAQFRTFNVLKFVFHGAGFGMSMAFIAVYYYKKEQKRQKQQDENLNS